MVTPARDLHPNRPPTSTDRNLQPVPSGPPRTAPRRSYLLRNAAFRATVLGLFVLVFVAIRVIKALVWSGTAAAPQGFLGHLMVWGSITWIVLIPWAVADLIGWMIFRRHSPASDGHTGSPIDHTVAFRIVTRGDQPRVVCETAHVILDTMAGRPLFPYSLEVVSDVPIANLPEHHAVRPLVVPDSYTTGNGATHKARALQYALEHSPIPDDAWILHLDEESHITPEVVEGIREAVAAEEASGELRIGQGLILYDRNIEDNTFLTLADSIRVADDMGRFYLQYRLNRVLFGMHGSFVLVRSDVEQRIGWDFPPDACVTEDTTWALMQMDAGTRFRWVDGTVVEQAPQTPMDFVKQRRRWFGGMWWGALRAPARLAYRSMLIMAMFIWSFGWLNLLFSYTHLFSGVLIPTPIAMLGDLVFATYITNYLIGLWVSLTNRRQPWPGRIKYVMLQVVLLPAYTALEGAAVVYALAKPEKGFHVVRKTSRTSAAT